MYMKIDFITMSSIEDELTRTTSLKSGEDPQSTTSFNWVSNTAHVMAVGVTSIPVTNDDAYN